MSNNGPAGERLVFSGCMDCLVVRLDRGNLATATDAAVNCELCGAAKQDVVFQGHKPQPACPVHAHARHLLSRAMLALRQLETHESSALRGEIAGVLEVQTEEKT